LRLSLGGRFFITSRPVPSSAAFVRGWCAIYSTKNFIAILGYIGSGIRPADLCPANARW
jgi:hypothetical protein